jgi:hypothetical protein
MAEFRLGKTFTYQAKVKVTRGGYGGFSIFIIAGKNVCNRSLVIGTLIISDSDP